MYKKSDDLFELIKSLLQTEKRYFKLSASKHKGEKNYMKLFNVIDKQKEYDEEAIKKLFAGQKFIRRLDVTKSYLYNLILQSSETYHSNIDMELRSKLNHIQFLLGKELYAQCEKIISRTRQLAEAHEKHLIILELSELEMEFIRSQSYRGRTEQETEKSFAEMIGVNNKFIYAKEYEQLATKYFIRNYQRRSVNPQVDSTGYSDIMNHPFLCINPEDNPKRKREFSYEALSYYYNIHSAYSFMRNEYSDAYSHALKSVQLMEDNPLQIKDKPHIYIARLSNLVLCQENLKKYDEVVLTLKKLKGLRSYSVKIKSQLFYVINSTELIMYIDTGQFEKGEKLITSIQNEFNRVRLSKHREMILYYNISYIYFGSQNYRQALNYLNKIINDSVTDVRSDIHCFARILNLLVHFELDNKNLLEYIVKSTHRFLYKRNRLYKVENSILNFIKNKLPKAITQNKLIQAFKELKTEMEEIMKDPFERKTLEYFDFISWLESKIESRPFTEIVREKVRLKK